MTFNLVLRPGRSASCIHSIVWSSDHDFDTVWSKV